MRGNIHRRLEDLEQRAASEAQEPQQRPLIRPELAAWLDEYAARKRAGTLTLEDEEFADALKAEVKERVDQGEISRWGGG